MQLFQAMRMLKQLPRPMPQWRLLRPQTAGQLWQLGHQLLPASQSVARHRLQLCRSSLRVMALRLLLNSLPQHTENSSWAAVEGPSSVTFAFASCAAA